MIDDLVSERRDQKWSASDLARRLCNALDVAEQVVERLAPKGYTDTLASGCSVPAGKLISETAVLLFAASAATHRKDVQSRVHSVARRLIPYARSRQMLLRICLEPALALDHGLAHVCLQRLAYPSPIFDELIGQSRSAQACAGRERPPHRVLEQQWIAESWKGHGCRARKRNSPLSKDSVLNQPMDLAGGNKDDLYAFTHALMYVTDFGNHTRRLPRARRVILEEAEAALARCLDEQDYDLSGELLLAWPLTGGSWSAAAIFGFHVLANVEDKAGFLPTPGTRLQRLNELQGDERTDYFLGTSYHSTYVMGLLAAAALRPGRAPPSKIPPNNALRGSASKILGYLRRDGAIPHWQHEVGRFTPSEQDSVAGMLLNIALYRMIRERRFHEAHELLSMCYSLGLADTPMASQTAELLYRLATVSKLTPEES